MIKCLYCDSEGKSEIYDDIYMCLPCLERKKNKNFFDKLKETVDEFKKNQDNEYEGL